MHIFQATADAFFAGASGRRPARRGDHPRAASLQATGGRRAALDAGQGRGRGHLPLAFLADEDARDASAYQSIEAGRAPEGLRRLSEPRGQQQHVPEQLLPPEQAGHSRAAMGGNVAVVGPPTWTPVGMPASPRWMQGAGPPPYERDPREPNLFDQQQQQAAQLQGRDQQIMAQLLQQQQQAQQQAQGLHQPYQQSGGYSQQPQLQPGGGEQDPQYQQLHRMDQQDQDRRFFLQQQQWQQQQAWDQQQQPAAFQTGNYGRDGVNMTDVARPTTSRPAYQLEDLSRRNECAPTHFPHTNSLPHQACCVLPARSQHVACYAPHRKRLGSGDLVWKLLSFAHWSVSGLYGDSACGKLQTLFL